MSDELEKERDLWIYRASFWLHVAQLSVTRNIMEGFEQGPQSLILKTLVKSYIFTGLENGFFSDEDDQAQEEVEYGGFADGDSPSMPWPIVVQIANDIEVDAAEVLRDYIEHAQGGLNRALGLAGMEEMEPVFAGVPISVAMAREIADGEFGPEFDKRFAGKYILHVMHGSKPCQHPYDSLDMAIEGAAIDLERGIISEVLHITHGSLVVLHDDEVRRRVAEIGNAGLN